MPKLDEREQCFLHCHRLSNGCGRRRPRVLYLICPINKRQSRIAGSLLLTYSVSTWRCKPECPVQYPLSFVLIILRQKTKNKITKNMDDRCVPSSSNQVLPSISSTSVHCILTHIAIVSSHRRSLSVAQS